MKQILMPDSGLYVKVDDKNFYWLLAYTWSACYSNNGKIYARTKIHGKTVMMHSLIMRAKPNEQIDHKDNDGQNNQEENLRVASRSQNGQNSVSRRGSTSQYKGVYYVTKAGKWRASIQVNKRKFYLGDFDCEIEAAKVYNEAAKKHHGEFARLNDV